MWVIGIILIVVSQIGWVWAFYASGGSYKERHMGVGYISGGLLVYGLIKVFGW